jgi:hypothetical protein
MYWYAPLLYGICTMLALRFVSTLAATSAQPSQVISTLSLMQRRALASGTGSQWHIWHIGFAESSLLIFPPFGFCIALGFVLVCFGTGLAYRMAVGKSRLTYVVSQADTACVRVARVVRVLALFRHSDHLSACRCGCGTRQRWC